MPEYVSTSVSRSLKAGLHLQTYIQYSLIMSSLTVKTVLTGASTLLAFRFSEDISDCSNMEEELLMV